MPLDAFVSRQRLVVLLAVGAALAYLNSFHGVFLFDDVNILSDSRLENLSSYVAHLGGMIRPALRLSFLGDRLLWGENPAGYHLLNVLLHLGSGIVFYAITLDLVRADSTRCRAVSETTVPFWTALLFLVHPVGTETVTYVSGRATGLMAFFYLAGLHLYLRASPPRSASAVSWTYLAAIACFLLSLLSKETAVTFPLALLLVEAIARGSRGANLRNAILRFQLPFWGVLLLYLSAAAFQPRYVYLLDTSLGIRPVSENLLTQVNVVAYALSLFVLPGRLSIEHDFPLAGSILMWPTPGALLLLVGLLASAVLLTRRNPLAAFGLFWFFLQLLPTNSVLPRYDLLSERNLYLPAPGLLLALVSLWAAHLIRLRQSPRASRWPRIGVGAMRVVPFALVPLLVAMTIARNAIYADPIAFWSDAVQKAPAKARPHVNLGHAYYLADDFDRAIAESRIALAIDRDDRFAQATLRAAWRRKNEADRPHRPPVGR
jgi:hypothetical protein